MARVRKSAEETRGEILTAAQTLLMQAGPDALRLDDVASEVGISRQAVLHHFGSRAGLMREVVAAAWGGLFEDLQTLATEARGGAPDAFVDHLDEVVRARGNARLGAWLLLSGEGLPDAAFEGALARVPGLLSPDGDPEEARRMLLLLGAALFGDAVFGGRLRQALDLPDDEAQRQDFRRWLVSLLWGEARR